QDQRHRLGLGWCWLRRRSREWRLAIDHERQELGQSRWTSEAESTSTSGSRCSGRWGRCCSRRSIRSMWSAGIGGGRGYGSGGCGSASWWREYYLACAAHHRQILLSIKLERDGRTHTATQVGLDFPQL